MKILELLNLLNIKDSLNTLNEVADSSSNYEVIRETPTVFRTEIILGNRKLVFSAREYEEVWDIVFEEQDLETGLSSTKKSGSGKEFKVSSFVVSSLKEFISRYSPDRLVFDAAKDGAGTEDARANVYEKLLARQFKEYEIIPTDFGSSVRFMMLKK